MIPLVTLCALIVPLCRLAALPQVRAALDKQPFDPGALRDALRRMPEELRALSPYLPEARTSLVAEPYLSLLSLCRQCSQEELLSVATRCTASLTTDALAALISEHRRQEAQRLYALQLLWRMNADPALPDALSLFPQNAPPRTGEDIRRDLITSLKGGAHA